jgi:ankyrin repeat protein
MSLKKDKQKVLGEFFDDDRIKTFLTDDDGFTVLERAYRGMIAENFISFVGFFIAAGKDINAKNTYGETFLQTIKPHKQAEEYIVSLEKNGAS